MRRWLVKEDIYKYPCLTLNEKNEGGVGGLPLAYDENRVYVAGGEEHSLIIGSTGSKKSRLLVIPSVVSMIKASENIIISDPKKEIYDLTHELAEKEGYTIVKVNFRDFEDSNFWNPLETLKSANDEKNIEKIYREIAKIAETYIITRTSRDPYWEMAGMEFLRMVLHSCVIKNKVNFKVFIKEVDRYAKIMLDIASYESEDEREKFQNKINEEIEELQENANEKKNRNYKKIYNTFYESFHKFLRMSRGTISSIIGVVSSSITAFSLSYSFLNKTIKSDFLQSDIIEKKLIIYLIIPEENASFDVLVKSFVESSYSYIIEYTQNYYKGKAPRRINYVLDEFANIPRIAEFQRNISISRSRNIRFTLIIQNLSQLKGKYGEYDTDTIVGNCNNIAYLYCNDDYTNRYIHYRVKDFISESGIRDLSKDRGEVLFLLGRAGEYIGSLKDIDEVLEVV